MTKDMKKIWIETTQKWHKGDEELTSVSMTEQGTIDRGYAESMSQMLRAGYVPGKIRRKKKVQIYGLPKITGMYL